MRSKIPCWSYRSLKLFISYKGEKEEQLSSGGIGQCFTRRTKSTGPVSKGQHRRPVEAAWKGRGPLCGALAGSSSFHHTVRNVLVFESAGTVLFKNVDAMKDNARLQGRLNEEKEE